MAPQGIDRMLHALRFRGPDDADCHYSDGAVLGQRRLSIIDVEGGRQPIPNEDRTAWVICNGEIYNFQELMEDLKKRGHVFSTRSDSEVILHMYEEFGEDCVSRLRGMFAFAIWDEKRQQLFIARDRLGQKPLYYVERAGEFLFASEIKALLAADPALAEIDLAALDQYLTLRVVASPFSMFKQIRKLAPAHALSFSKERGLKIWRYWDLDYEPKLQGSENDIVDELESRLIECLKLHMVSDVPVGAFMSGGLDSTLVVAMLMKHVMSEPIRTFSMGLPYKQFDEAPYARMVAEAYGTQHREKIVTPSLLASLPKLVWHLDEPSDPLSVCSYLIAEMASEDVKVVLGGDGGDELFGGYDRYYGNRFASHYALIPELVRRHLIGPVLEKLPDGSWYKSHNHMLKWLHHLSFAEGGARYARSLSYFYFGSNRRSDLYGPEMRERARSFDPEEPIRSAYDAAHATDAVDRMLYADNQIRLPDHPVMILDRMTMAHGLEARSPFMDHEIAEFAARLPEDLKVKGRSLRRVQVKLAKRYLPEAVMNRPKQGFSSALPYMLRDEYRALYKIFLRDCQLAGDGIFAQPAIDQLLAEHEAGNADHGNRLWLLVNSEAWYRMHIKGESIDSMEALIADHGKGRNETAMGTAGPASLSTRGARPTDLGHLSPEAKHENLVS
ncbi:MAG: asparagine synthase (glutamine-hydrolyzing) [Rhodospirillales bacterium]|nr:asparagine synthase (glutamine-hydrolyzing) [Rhodospirillales bacterium]